MLEEKARYAKDMAFMEQQIQQKRVEKDEKAAADRQTLKEYQALLDRQDAARAQALADMHAKSQVRISLSCAGFAAPPAVPPHPLLELRCASCTMLGDGRRGGRDASTLRTELCVIV